MTPSALATQIDELSGSADGYVGAEDIKMMMQVFAETIPRTTTHHLITRPLTAHRPPLAAL